MTREQIIDAHPLLQYCQARGMAMRRSGAEFSCKCPWHDDRTPSFFADPNKQLWICRAGCGGGSIVDLHMKLNNLSVGEAMAELGGDHDFDRYQERNQQKPERKEPDPFSDEEKAAMRANWPAFDLPTKAEIEIIAGLRGLSKEGVTLAAEAGLLFCADSHEGRMWVVSDNRRISAQGRRFDGRKWVHIGNKKAWTLPGGIASWPIGLCEAKSFPGIALVEGAPDLLGAYHLIWIAGQETSVAPVAMLGTMPIPKQVLPLFAGRRVRIFAHDDEPGLSAVDTWSAALKTAGATVDGFSFHGWHQSNGEPVEDLNDFLRIDYDEWENERSLVESAFNFVPAASKPTR